MTEQIDDVQPAAASVPERSLSLAHRMLCGAGSASVVAYGLTGQPTLDAVAHGLTERGELVIAVSPLPGTCAHAVAARDVLDVRLDITKLSPEPRTEILAATAHMLGRLEWLSAPDAAARLHGGGLPELVAAVAGTPRGRLGVVHVSRVLLHDGAGVTPVPFDRVARRQLVRGSSEVFELESVGWDIAASIDAADLACLGDAVSRGWIHGRLLGVSPFSAPATASRQVFVVDVDLTGLTIVRVQDLRASVYHVPFECMVSHAQALPSAVATLIGLPVGASRSSS